MGVEDRQGKGQSEEESGQPSREFYQHIGGLSAENVFGDASAKSCAESFALWTLHQNQQLHGDGEYGETVVRSKHPTRLRPGRAPPWRALNTERATSNSESLGVWR